MLDGCTREFDKHGSLKIMEMEANTYPKEPSESYIETTQACKHKMPLYLFRFSVLFTNGHFIIEQSISQNQNRNLLGLSHRFQIHVRKSKNYTNFLSDNFRLLLLSHHFSLLHPFNLLLIPNLRKKRNQPISYLCLGNKKYPKSVTSPLKLT